MEKLSICILSIDPYPQYLGGIKRVTTILGGWLKHDFDIFYLTFTSSTLRPSHVKEIPQFFFPETSKINTTKNIIFADDFIRRHQIKILLNPHVENHEFCKMTFEIKKATNVKLISILHFCPNHLYEVTRHSYFNQYVLGINPLKWLRDIILWIRFKLYRGYQIHQQQRERQHEVIKNSDKYVLLSKSYLKYYDSEEREHITIINNPIDDIGKDKHLNKGKIVIWCGRLDLTGAKRVDRILRIWKKLSKSHLDWKLYLLGNGNYTLIKNLIRSHSIKNVKVIGFCNAYDYYDKASILTLTSTTEGWGMVLVEAQQFGCVPIAFDSYDSIKEIIQNGETGFLIKPFNLNEYANRLSYIMEHSEVRERISIKAKESVTRFNVSCIAQQWNELFNSLL